MDIETAVEELYRLPPEEFTGRRDELAALAKKDGDSALAQQVRTLRRPTAGAALMNRLAREEAGSLADYLELGEQLREAQASLSGDDLRRLGQERQRAAATLVKRAVLLAPGPVSPAVRGELDATLLAAVADPAAGQAVVSGALTRSLSYAGLGEVDITAATATPLSPVAPSAAAPAPPRSTDESRRRAKADQLAERRTSADERVQQAEADVRDAARAVQSSMQAELDAEHAQQAAEREVEELRERLTQARFAVRAAQQQLTTARSDRTAAERSVGAAEKARDKARRQRDILGED